MSHAGGLLPVVGAIAGAFMTSGASLGVQLAGTAAGASLGSTAANSLAKPPAPPPLAATPTMPAMNQPAIAQAQLASTQQQMARGGRISTILNQTSPTDRLGG